LLNLIESYKSPDGKKRCRFISARRRLLVLQLLSRQVSKMILLVVSDASWPVLTTPDDLSQDQSSINHPIDDQSMALPDFKPSATPV